MWLKQKWDWGGERIKDEVGEVKGQERFMEFHSQKFKSTTRVGNRLYNRWVGNRLYNKGKDREVRWEAIAMKKRQWWLGQGWGVEM